MTKLTENEKKMMHVFVIHHISITQIMSCGQECAKKHTNSLIAWHLIIGPCETRPDPLLSGRWSAKHDGIAERDIFPQQRAGPPSSFDL